MYRPDSTEAVVQASRFLLGRRSLDDVLPGVGRSVPPLTYVEYMDTTKHRAALGYPVVSSSGLLVDLHRLVVAELGQCLADPDHIEDVEALSVAALSDDPYVRRLTELLIRAQAHGEHLRLDALIWLEVARMVAGLLNRDPALAEELRLAAPRGAAKGERYLVELLRLKGSDAARHATVERRVLRVLFARNDFAIRSTADVLGDAYSSPLYRAMVRNRILFTEKPGGLYQFFDLREAFGVRELAIPLADWSAISQLLRALAADAYAARGRGDASAEQDWFVSRFGTDDLLEKAGRLDIAELGATDASRDTDEFAGRVAWLMCLQPPCARYLLAHLEPLGMSKSARRLGLDRDLVKQLKAPGAAQSKVGPFVTAVEEVLRWDFLNTLRGFLSPVTRDDTGRLLLDGGALRRSVVAVDLESKTELYDRRRHGTVVVLDIAGFVTTAEELIGGQAQADVDFATLCVRQLTQVRRSVDMMRGRPELFARGRLIDVFPRALDALRYVALFRGAFEKNREVRPLPWEESRGNPFAAQLRAGLGTGDYVEVAIPSGGVGDGEPAADHPVGTPVELARRFVVPPGPSAVTASVVEEYDPLQAFQARVAGGRLDNRGLLSNAETFREVLQAVRIEGLPLWSKAAPDGSVAGRKIQMKNYRFELIFDDPATGRIVLVRRVESVSALSDFAAAGGVYEYLLMWPEEFATFLDRVQDRERHQPALRQRRAAGGATSPPAPRSRTRAPSAPVEPEPLPAAALNLPDEGDFDDQHLGRMTEAEQRLGMSHSDSLLGEPLGDPERDLTGGLSGAFDWGWGDDADGAAAPSSEIPPAPTPSFDFGAAPGWDAGSEEPAEAAPLEDDDPPRRGHHRGRGRARAVVARSPGGGSRGAHRPGRGVGSESVPGDRRSGGRPRRRCRSGPRRGTQGEAAGPPSRLRAGLPRLRLLLGRRARGRRQRGRGRAAIPRRLLRSASVQSSGRRPGVGSGQRRARLPAPQDPRELRAAEPHLRGASGGGGSAVPADRGAPRRGLRLDHLSGSCLPRARCWIRLQPSC